MPAEIVGKREMLAAIKAAFNAQVEVTNAANASLSAAIAAGASELAPVAAGATSVVNALNAYGPKVAAAIAALPAVPLAVVNLAKTGVATASSLFSGHAASGAINGDRRGLNWSTGGGWNDGTPNTFPDWLQIDFGSTKNISEVDVFSVQDTYLSPVEPTEAMTFTLYGLKDFQVQYRSGGSWTDVPGGNVTGNNKVWRKFTFPPIDTDAIRVLVNATQDQWSRIVEVEAWGAGSAPVPTPVGLGAKNEQTGVFYPGADGPAKAIAEAAENVTILINPGVYEWQITADSLPAKVYVDVMP